MFGYQFIKVMSKASNAEAPEAHSRRDQLIEMQNHAQKMWREEKANVRSADDNPKKHFTTIPYPYVNARLHLGHGFSYIKADVFTRYKNLKGFNALFPLGFHGTGMPIYAAAQKLKFELENIGMEKLSEKYAARMAKTLDSADAKMTQFEIMLMSGTPKEEIIKFTDPKHWLRHFPRFVQQDLEKFGAGIDFSRSFVTTDMNPYYDSFIRWQFEQLRKGSAIKFGLRPSIYSIKDQQMCADHDRSVGEGVLPQEYTIIKLQLCTFKSPKLEKLQTEYPNSTFILPAATLRPETMYGQTNCFVHPTGEYAIVQMSGEEIWIFTERAARNCAYQNLTVEKGKYTVLGTVAGAELIGEAIKAPLTSYEHVFVWPMFSLDMDKGTGVVTSVPSDSPDDYAVMCDLKKKRELREKFGLKDEQVLPFCPSEVLEVPDYSRMSAITAYEQFNITSMNDKEKLARAKEEVYLKANARGCMLVGEWAGKPINEARPLIRQQLMSQGLATKYWEPNGQCVSRTGDHCVVALLEQWFIAYGEEPAFKRVTDHVTSQSFKTFNEGVRGLILEGVNWLKEWGCSRSFGLGTRIPWDEQFVIESLSDSTIYMAYYTIAHLLHGDLYGSQPGILGIRAEDIQSPDWSYVFLGAPYNPESKLPEESLAKMRKEFLYWYPVDVRFSGKDLAKNHMIMSLYNHEFVWDQANLEMLPRGYYLNGLVMINGRKMSKQEGNFLTIDETVTKYGADATRLMLANAGDGLDDANAELSEADNAILRLHAFSVWLKDISKSFSILRRETIPETAFVDCAFINETRNLIKSAEKSYESMLLRDVVKALFFNLLALKEEYRINCGDNGMSGPLIKEFIKGALTSLFPIIPHFCEIMWIETYLPILSIEERELEVDRCRKAEYPKTELIDHSILRQKEFISQIAASVRSALEKIVNKKKGTVKSVFVVCASEFTIWQKRCIEILKERPIDFKEAIKEELKSDPKLLAKSIEFATFRSKQSSEGIDLVEGELNAYELLNAHKALLQRDLKAYEIIILRTSDALAHEQRQVVQAAEACIAGKPQIVIIS